MKEKELLVGGMALIEGVMMKSPKRIGIAVRSPEGKIVTKKFTFTSITKKFKILGLPILRGIVNMIEMMTVGIKALNHSADVALEEEEREKEEEKKKSVGTIPLMIFSVIFGIVLAVLLFKFLPFGAATLFEKLFPSLGKGFLFNVVEGLIKIFIFILYLYLISFMPDIKRVFEYHGAEHKTVSCHERKMKLTVANVKKCSRFHPRCGTSFVIFILLLSIIVYTFIPADMSFWGRFGWRLLLLPVIAGISYEILRFSAKRNNSWLFKIISAPGLWTQRVTTNEPDAKEIEVAIKALKISL